MSFALCVNDISDHVHAVDVNAVTLDAVAVVARCVLVCDTKYSNSILRDSYPLVNLYQTTPPL